MSESSTPNPQNVSSSDPRIVELVSAVGGETGTYEADLVQQIIATALKLIPEAHDTGQIKLITAAMKEMRYAYQVFNRYTDRRKIAIFGSARTPEDHPDYIGAMEFSRKMAHAEWMSITGAGDGIMKAGHEGPKKESSFGLSIRLPFETSANTVIEGDPKLINFRYFFTRKLMFLSHADAVAVFPGGYGTQDELFEALTLIQTGKSNIVPVVLLQGAGSCYWQDWQAYVRERLLQRGMISEEDEHLYFIASNADEAVAHVCGFYRLFHSSRYVGPKLIIRLQRKISDEHLAALNDEFAFLVRSGVIVQRGALSEETDHLDLLRLVFDHQRHKYGELRRMIDRINSCADNDA